MAHDGSIRIQSEIEAINNITVALMLSVDLRWRRARDVTHLDRNLKKCPVDEDGPNCSR
jgi:hypothetical protein